jgi:hypothetical protein
VSQTSDRAKHGLTSACSWRALQFKGTWDCAKLGQSPQLMRRPLDSDTAGSEEKDRWLTSSCTPGNSSIWLPCHC